MTTSRSVEESFRRVPHEGTRVRRPILGAVTALVFTAQTSGLAHADPPQGAELAPPSSPARAFDDYVYLKDGGMMRGMLVEVLPNERVTIQLPSGQSDVVDWARVDHVERAGAQAGPGPLAPPPPPRAPANPAGTPTARVHIEAQPGVVLESTSPGDLSWSVACKAPCDAMLPLDGRFRLSGENIRRSRPFSLTAKPGNLVFMRVTEGSKAGFSGGIALTSVGFSAVVVGLTVVLVGAIGSCVATTGFGFCARTQSDGNLEGTGGLITLGGVVVTLVGVAIFASNLRTKQTQTITGLLAAPAPRPETGWLRAPSWHDAVRESPGAPRSMGVPLVTQTF